MVIALICFVFVASLLPSPPAINAQSSTRRLVLSADGSQSIELMLDRHICNNGIGQLYRMHSFSMPIFNSCAEWCLRHSQCSIFDYESRRKSWYCWFYKSASECRPQPFIYAEVYVKKNLVGGEPAPTTLKMNNYYGDSYDYAETPTPLKTLRGTTTFEPPDGWGGSAGEVLVPPPPPPSSTPADADNNDGADDNGDNGADSGDATVLKTPAVTPPSSTSSSRLDDFANSGNSEEVTEATSEIMVIPLIIEDTTSPASPGDTPATSKPSFSTPSRPAAAAVDFNNAAEPPKPQSIGSTFRPPSIIGRSIAQSLSDELPAGIGTPSPPAVRSWSSKPFSLSEASIPKIVLNVDAYSTQAALLTPTTTWASPYRFDSGQFLEDATTFPPATYSFRGGGDDDDEFGTRSVVAFGENIVTVPSSSPSTIFNKSRHQVAHLLLLTFVPLVVIRY